MSEHEFIFSKDKSVVLNEDEMYKVYRYYGVLLTAQYLAENYENLDADCIWGIAQQVRELMLRKDYDEQEAIDKVLSELYREE